MNRCSHIVFNRRSLFIHRLALALVLSIPTLAAGDYWTTPFKADACVAPGYRQYTAQLMGIVGSWEAACTGKPADINGQHFEQPARCVKNNGMWGEFDVRDTTCDPTWATINRQTCRGKGVRQYSGQLMNIVGSWEAACANMPATVAGQYFEHPSRCIVNNGMWGEFDVSDESCPHWVGFKKYQCTDVGKRQYSSVLADIAPGTDWKTACYAQGAVIEGRAFDAPARCSENGGAMWGEFDVEDSSCIPHWGYFKPASCCVKLGVKRYSAQLIDIPTGVTWEHACAVMPATVNGQYFPTPSECANRGIDGMFGYFDANDNSCFASWGNTTSQCFSKGVRRFSAYIVAECGIDRSAACAVTPQSIWGVNFPSPDSCSSPNPGAALGTFNVPDKCCFPDGLDIPSCAPPAQVPRLVATDGLKIWPTDKTAYATAKKFQLDVEHGWRNKISVYADGALVLDVDPGRADSLNPIGGDSVGRPIKLKDGQPSYGLSTSLRIYREQTDSSEYL